jgi:hypothetical protein
MNYVSVIRIIAGNHDLTLDDEFCKHCPQVIRDVTLDDKFLEQNPEGGDSDVEEALSRKVRVFLRLLGF